MIYAVRHGETDWNAEGKIQGQSETNLTQKGIAQAEGLREEFKDIKFDAVFCSPLVRTKDTCKIIVGDNININYEPCLMERDFGVMTGKVDNFMLFWNLKKPKTAKNLETIEEMEKRIFPFMEGIVNKYAGKNVLIVTHQGPLFIMENFFGYKPDDGNYLLHFLHGGGYRIYNEKTKEKTEYGLNPTGFSG